MKLVRWHSWHTNSVCNAKPQELSGCTIAQEDYVLSVTFPRCGHFIDADHVSVASEATTAAVGTKLSHMRRTLEAFKLLQFWDGSKDETAGSSDILATSCSLSCHCPCSCRLAALRFTGSIDQQQALGLLTYYVCLKSFLGGGAGYYWVGEGLKLKKEISGIAMRRLRCACRSTLGHWGLTTWGQPCFLLAKEN